MFLFLSRTESMPDGIDSAEGSERGVDQPQKRASGENP